MSSVPTSITSALESISTSCGDVIRDVGEFTPSHVAGYAAARIAAAAARDFSNENFVLDP